MAPRRRSGPHTLPVAVILVAVAYVALLLMMLASGGAFWFTALIMTSIVGIAFGLWRVRQGQKKKGDQQDQQRRMDALRTREEQQERDTRFRRRTLGELRTFTPPQFGHYIGNLLEHMGCQQVEHRGGGGDLAADLQCLDDDGNEVIVRCRRWKPRRPVGPPEIQEFLGMIYIQHQADRGLFVTTNEFTMGAKELAEEQGIELWDGQALRELIQKYAPEGPRRSHQVSPSYLETSTSQSAFCTECGQAVEGTDSYCRHCGASLQLDP